MYGYGTPGDAIVGYTYQADNHCPPCIWSMFARQASQDDHDTEAVLDTVARARGIDRYDERSFDSGDFPKVIFSSQLEDIENCGSCHDKL
jgi:hypothetical protein